MDAPVQEEKMKMEEYMVDGRIVANLLLAYFERKSAQTDALQVRTLRAVRAVALYCALCLARSVGARSALRRLSPLGLRRDLLGERPRAGFRLPVRSALRRTSG